MTIAAIYGRKSAEDERSADDGRSVDRQVALAREFAGRQGWAVAESWVITEEASGADFTRAGLIRLLAGARQRPRPFDVLVVMAVDRLGREQVRTAALVQALHEAGVAVWTYQDGREVSFETPVEKFMLGVHGFGAEEYRHQVKLKTREALHRKAARGHATGSRTYGYRLVRQGEHTEREIDAAEAAVVTRVFELSAEGYGDQRIVGLLSADRVPAPGSRGLWSKEILRTMLRNELYRGVAIYGKSKSVDKGGSASKREWVPKKDWTRAEVPHLRIIDDALWQRVQARKQKTREYFVRPPDGRLVGKPDAGIVASRMLSGIARCACGGALTYMGKKGPRPRYYCIERSHRGPAACANRHGVPMDALDRAVLTCVLDDLLSDRERLWTLIQENDERNKREREVQKAGRPDAAKHIQQLETEIGRLVAALASGKASSDIAAAIAERRAKVEALTAAPEPKGLDRQSFLTGYPAFRVLLNQRHPVQVRQTLRKLGIDRIVVRRGQDGTSWDFEGVADVSSLLNKGAPADHTDSHSSAPSQTSHETQGFAFVARRRYGSTGDAPCPSRRRVVSESVQTVALRFT